MSRKFFFALVAMVMVVVVGIVWLFQRVDNVGLWGL